MTVKERLVEHIKKTRRQVLLRSEFDGFGDYRQVGRLLQSFEKDGLISRIGHGIYSKNGFENRSVEDGLKMLRKRLGRRVKRTVLVGGQFVELGGHKSGKKNSQDVLDEFKAKLAAEVLRLIPLPEIREKSLANLDRWRMQGVWGKAYDEWEQLLQLGDDDLLKSALTGDDQNSKRLRKSAPYVGLLDKKMVEKLRETKRP